MRSVGAWNRSMLRSSHMMIYVLSANHAANGAREYIWLASTDEWMSCRGGTWDEASHRMGNEDWAHGVYLEPE